MAEERKMASTNIYIELRDTLDGLNGDTHPEDAMSFGIGDGQNMFFMNRIFNHDFYDGLICSGRISLLKPDLQQKIRDVFKNIKEYNGVLRRPPKRGMNSETGCRQRRMNITCGWTDANRDLWRSYQKYRRI